MKPYLIQRASFGNNSFKKGIDSILYFDYMGSAEFEFGALPKSLKRIRENISDYCITTFNINNKKVSVFYSNKLIKNPTELSKIMDGLATNQFHLKEYCDFRNYIFTLCPSSYISKNDFWWDIENDYMFWKTNNEFEIKFIKEIKPK